MFNEREFKIAVAVIISSVFALSSIFGTAVLFLQIQKEEVSWITASVLVFSLINVFGWLSYAISLYKYSQPRSPRKGDICVDSETGKPIYWDGVRWWRYECKKEEKIDE